MMTGWLTKTILSSQLLDSIQSEYFWGLHIHLQFKFGAQTLKPSITFDWVVEHIHPAPQYEQNILVKAMRILNYELQFESKVWISTGGEYL